MQKAQKSVSYRRLRFEKYKNSLEPTHIENKIN